MTTRSRSLAAPICALSVLALAAACSQEAAQTTAEAQTPAAATQTKAPAAIKVANFTLADQNGVSHELYSMTDADAIVLIMQGNGCPIVQKMLPTIKDIATEYGAKNVKFLMINSNFQDQPDGIKAEAEKFDIEIPILKDADQSLGKRLEAVRTAEAFVIDPKSWALLYHGPIDDRLTYGREKPAADNHYLADVLDAKLEGREIPHPEKQQADGCLINYV